MNIIHKYLKQSIILFSSIVLIPIILSLINVFSINTNKIMIIIIGAILMFFIGLITGRKSNSKGYLNGLLVSIFIIIIFIIISLIFQWKININSLLYYMVLIISTVFGSMLGINKKTKSN